VAAAVEGLDGEVHRAASSVLQARSGSAPSPSRSAIAGHDSKLIVRGRFVRR
jgi:hypothetical protein